jgi:hypothetical protein
MTTIADIASTPQHSVRLAFWIKWIASIFQIVGYGTTAFGWAPWNIYLFLIGLIGWLIVGILWRDRAIILIHLIALAAMAVGLISG